MFRRGTLSAGGAIKKIGTVTFLGGIKLALSRSERSRQSLEREPKSGVCTLIGIKSGHKHGCASNPRNHI